MVLSRGSAGIRVTGGGSVCESAADTTIGHTKGDMRDISVAAKVVEVGGALVGWKTVR